MKRFVVHFDSPAGRQEMTLLAKDSGQARQLAERAQFRRHERFPLLFDRLQQAHERGDLTPEAFRAETERRKRDEGRYDDGQLKIKRIVEVK